MWPKIKGVFKGGRVQGVQTPPPEIFRFFLKSEGKEIERKRKKKVLGGGGGLPLNIFLGVDIFSSGVEIFSGGVEIFSGVEKFSGGAEKFSWGVEKFSGGG